MNINPNSWHYRLWMHFLTKSPIVKLVTDSREYRTWVPDENGELDEWGWKKGHYEIHPPQNLCAYVNRLPFIAFLSSIVSLLLGLLIAILIVLPFMDLFLDIWFGQMFFGELSLIACAEIIAFTAVGVVILVHTNKLKVPTALATPMKKIAPTLDVVCQYMSDRHHKICRKLTFNDK